VREQRRRQQSVRARRTSSLSCATCEAYASTARRMAGNL
jgi:hypothetical protein